MSPQMGDGTERYPRRWIGRWLIGVGVLHLLVALAVFGGPLGQIAAGGVIGAVNSFPDRQLAFWFAMGGPLVLIVGGLVDGLESQRLGIPRWLGWAVLAFGVIGVAAMPLSGFWVFLPPGLAVLMNRPAQS